MLFVFIISPGNALAMIFICIISKPASFFNFKKCHLAVE